MMKHHGQAYQQLQIHPMIAFRVAGCYSIEHGREA